MPGYDCDVTPHEACQGNGFFEPEVIGAAVAACAAVKRPDGLVMSGITIGHGRITVRLVNDYNIGEAAVMRCADEIRTLATRWARDAGWRSKPLNGWPALPPAEPSR